MGFDLSFLSLPTSDLVIVNFKRSHHFLEINNVCTDDRDSKKLESDIGSLNPTWIYWKAVNRFTQFKK